jgi:ferredoxin
MNDTPVSGAREGSLEAPTRHPLDWKGPEFHDRDALFNERERVFDICHGCRRCFSLCQAFPTLFDAVDATPDGELHGVPKKAYWQVVDNCYLCDMCYMTKCPYGPPHPWNVDFPHVMLRAKVVKHAEQRTSLRDRLLSSTDTVDETRGQVVLFATSRTAATSRPARTPAMRSPTRTSSGRTTSRPQPCISCASSWRRVRDGCSPGVRRSASASTIRPTRTPSRRPPKSAPRSPPTS